MLKRRQWFEFCDQAWLPAWMREGCHDCLSFIHQIYQPYHGLVLPLAEWTARAEVQVLLDLGSGAAEQISKLIESGSDLKLCIPKIVASDKYPNVEIWKILHQKLGSEAFDYIPDSVSASAVRACGVRYWSIFSAF